MADVTFPIEYRLYVDEAGDHAACTADDAAIGKRYLGLIGLVLPPRPRRG